MKVSEMDLLDYFAAQVVSGFGEIGDRGYAECLAQYAYMVAEAMMKEREKRKLI